MSSFTEVYNLIDELWELQRVEYWGIECSDYARTLCNEIRRKVNEVPLKLPATKAVIIELVDTAERCFKPTS